MPADMPTPDLIENLKKENWELIETHISWVLLSDEFAYKFKKPVALGFLDFSSLDRRRYYCEEELRLNRRLAPDWYLGVVPIYGSPQHPRFAQAGEAGGKAIEYAVKMRRFPNEQRLDRVLVSGRLSAELMQQLAGYIARFHENLPPASLCSDFGSPGQILKPTAENFSAIEKGLKQHTNWAQSALTPERTTQNGPGGDVNEVLARLTLLQRWSHRAGERLSDYMERRRRSGFVRECHGDLHLENLFLDNTSHERAREPLPITHVHLKSPPNTHSATSIVAFDCIEFDPDLRWIDVINEIAFLMMDLDSRHESGLAWTFLNAYLELRGDYDGLKGLRYYLVYRAMVRAKVAAGFDNDV